MKVKAGSRTEVMGKAPIWRLLFRFSGPAIVSMMVAASYNLVDAIFVGRLGSEALAALVVAFPLMMLFMGVSMGTGVGASSLISRRLGAGDREGANRIAGNTITLAIILGLLMTGICLPNLETFLRLLGATDSVLSPAKDYMSILVTFAVINSFSLIVGNIVRAEGNPILSSTTRIISAVINIVLDPILIFGVGPIPAMGVAGAATATVIGRGIGGLIFLVYLISRATSYRFRLGYFLLNLKILAEIYRVGMASIVRMTAGSLVMGFNNRIAASFGVVTLAVVGVVIRFARFTFMPTMGLGQGMIPLVGYNFGAKQKERVGEIVIKAVLASFIWGLMCWIAVMLFPSQLMSIFNNDPEFLLEGAPALRIFALLFFAVGIQRILSSFFQGIGKGLPSLVLTSSTFIFRLLGLVVFPKMFGLTGLWMVFPVADVFSIALTLLWTGTEFRRQGMQFHLALLV